MTKGIVLKKIDYLESSFIINVLSCDGYDSLMVKGAKRKNSLKLSISEPITLIEYEKTKSTKMATLIEASVLNNYTNIKNDLIKLSIASVVLEYAYLVRDSINNIKELFELVVESLDEINNSNDDIELILFKFEIVLLKYLGSSINKEYLKTNYLVDDENIKSIESIIKNENDNLIDKKYFRNFIVDYYYKECGIKLKSKKIYLEII